MLKIISDILISHIKSSLKSHFLDLLTFLTIFVSSNVFKKNNMKKILLFTILVFTGIVMYSATITSVTSGNWNTASTWDNGVPTANDDVIIANGHTINVISSSGVAESITINSGGKLRLYQTLTVDNTSSNAGTLSINESDGKLILSAGNFTNSGILQIAKSRQMTMADASTLANSGSITITSDSDEFGTLVLNGTYTASGSGSVTYGRFVSGVSNNWDLIGSPVTGQDAADFISSNGDIAVW